MSTRQVGEFAVTAVSDGVLYSNHDVILGVPASRCRSTSTASWSAIAASSF
jgi:hypothetical protein